MTGAQPHFEYRESHTVEEAEQAYIAAVGEFLFALVHLERQLDVALARAFTASWPEQSEFEKVWLEEMMLGSKIARLEATLRERRRPDKKLIRRLRSLNDVRNHLAHRMPGMGLDEELTFHFEKGRKSTALTIADIASNVTEARALGSCVQALGLTSRPGPQSE